MLNAPVNMLVQSPLIIVCDWIPPAFGAVGQYQLASAREAVQSDRCVTLIGLGSSYTNDEEAYPNGTLKIVRIPAQSANKASTFSRALWALSVSARLLQEVRRAVQGLSACEIKVTGSPPFFAYLILLWRLVQSGVTITYRITDFYPETAFAAGKAMALRPVLPLIHALRRTSDRIEALSPCQALRLQESGVPKDRIMMVRDPSPVAITPDVIPAQRPFPRGDAILLYSGNLGIAHDWLTFAEAYRQHIRYGSNRLRLWLNATGIGIKDLHAFCELNELPVHVTPPVPLEALPGVLMAADAHLVSLKEPFWGYVIPSKIYGCLATNRPVLYIGPAQSDLHALVSGYPRNYSVRNGDVKTASEALETIAIAVPNTTEHRNSRFNSISRPV